MPTPVPPARFLLACLLALGLATALGAAEGEPDVDLLARNNEMPRPDETEQAWAQTVDGAEAEAGPAPVFTGFMMWRGRADREYKPFHQWEIRLTGGTEDVAGLRFRLIPMGLDLEPLQGQTGHWVVVGDLGADETIDTSYKLNCSAPSAMRIEAEWEGGEATYFATATGGLPQREDPDGGAPKVLAMPPEYQYLKRQAKAGVKYRLLNKGDVEAREVVQTILFRDQRGEIVHQVEHIPNETGVLPPGYDAEQRLVVEHCPPFDTVAITTSMGASGGGFDPGEFTGIADLEVAHLSIEDDVLAAQVRNGLGEPVIGLVVTVDLLDDGGGVLASVDIDVGDIEAGTTRSVSGELSADLDVAEIGGWSAGFAFAGGSRDASGDDRALTMDPIVVEGLRLEVRGITPAGDKQVVAITLTNTRDQAIDGLSTELTFSDADGDTLAVPMAIGDLDPGVPLDLTVDVAGIADVAGVRMTWQAGG